MAWKKKNQQITNPTEDYYLDYIKNLNSSDKKVSNPIKKNLYKHFF